MHGNPLIKLAVGAISLFTGSLIGIVAGLLAGALLSWSVFAAHTYFSDSALSPTAKQQAEPSRSVDQFVPSDPPEADQPPFPGLVPWTGSHPSDPAEADQPRITVEQREAIARAQQRVDERAARVERQQPARSELVLTIAMAIGGLFGLGVAIGVGYRATCRIFQWAYS